MAAKSFNWRVTLPQVFLLFFIVAGAVAASEPDPWLRPEVAPAPPENEFNTDRAQLGEMLFWDPRLSKKGAMSCASCHNPALGWADGLPTAVGFDMQKLGRATPTILNTAFNTIQMWDGRKANLEEQALGPIAAEGEMNLPLHEMVARLKAIPGYAPEFDKAYPGQGISEVTVARAIASFERTVLSTESPFDRWRKGDQNAVSPAAKRGFELFTGKAKCSVCHMGYNFTDNGFHNIGVKDENPQPDVGRFAQRKVKAMQGAFKTPTLRDIALTAPYMRNGMYKSLTEVVQHYNRAGDVKENLDINMVPLDLSPAEVADVVAFMESLTGAQRVVSVPVLPR
jgi:cytochrome c peroxidase